MVGKNPTVLTSGVGEKHFDKYCINFARLLHSWNTFKNHLLAKQESQNLLFASGKISTSAKGKLFKWQVLNFLNFAVITKMQNHI